LGLTTAVERGDGGVRITGRQALLDSCAADSVSTLHPDRGRRVRDSGSAARPGIWPRECLSRWRKESSSVDAYAQTVNRYRRSLGACARDSRPARLIREPGQRHLVKSPKRPTVGIRVQVDRDSRTTKSMQHRHEGSRAGTPLGGLSRRARVAARGQDGATAPAFGLATTGWGIGPRRRGHQALQSLGIQTRTGFAILVLDVGPDLLQ